MQQSELLVALLLAVVLLAWLAERLRVAYPVVLLLGGVGLGLLPHAPAVVLDPDLVLVIFLPPLLYWETVNAPARAFREAVPAIVLLAVGLVLATTAVVAAVAHALVPGMGWAVAFVLGAIVAPTDAVAAEAVATRSAMPVAMLAVVQGESLVNDATALVAYRLALRAAVSGFAWGAASAQFVWVSVGGLAFGWLVGWAITWLWREIPRGDPEAMLSLLAPYATYLPAQALGVSGVLAVVAAGLVIARRTPFELSPRTRVRTAGFWDTAVFAANGVTFVLVGYQFHSVVARLSISPARLALLGVGVSAAVVMTRLLWTYPGARVSYLLRSGRRRNLPPPPWRSVTVVGWIGMRGGLSFAAALAIPQRLGGAPFPQRDLLIFLTFAVIFATLIGQGASLPALLRWARLAPDLEPLREQRLAQRRVAEAALRELTPPPEGVPEEQRAAWQLRFQSRLSELDAAEQGALAGGPSAPMQQWLHRLLRVRRDALRELSQRGEVDNTTLRQEIFALDAEELSVAPSDEA